MNTQHAHNDYNVSQLNTSQIQYRDLVGNPLFLPIQSTGIRGLRAVYGFQLQVN
jgi:hypothetical protein